PGNAESGSFGFPIKVTESVGGPQSQDARGEAVVRYCDPLATLDLGSSGAFSWDASRVRLPA
ncbi:MAG: hypothetical protein PVG41_07465, partial [Desulfobacteraceae bacterium]